MGNPIWQTNYDLGSFSNDTFINIPLIATVNSNAVSISYTLVSGILPTNTTLSIDGFLSGTIITSYTNNVFNFTVKATDNLGNYSLRTFKLTAVILIQPPVWVTQTGNIGTYVENSALSYQFVAEPVLPATTLTYQLLSSELPSTFTLSTNGLLVGYGGTIPTNKTYNFVIRAIDNLQNIKDRAFSLTIQGNARPTLTTPGGSILITIDSVWIDLPITYNNPISTNQIQIFLQQGLLPPGLEINSEGVIRGYPTAPVNEIVYDALTTNITQTSLIGNLITCPSTLNFRVGRPIIFSGDSFGNIVPGHTYYINSINDANTFTISNTQNGSTYSLINGIGNMVASLPAVTFGQPTIRTYNFILELQSIYGNDTQSYSITVVNQNLPISEGGPGLPDDTRTPTILNTRPLTYTISTSDPYYGYYLPINDPSVLTDLGTYKSGEYFSFKFIGYDFDGDEVNYSFNNVPVGLDADVVTGWITGVPALQVNAINEYNFSVTAYKANNPSIVSDTFNFSFILSNEITGTIIWATESDLGTIYNGSLSILSVNAICDVDLTYIITDGQLPPNLTMLSNGEITGYVAFQPGDSYLNVGTTSTYTFTVQAYSELYPIITSTKTFTVEVLQEFANPSDTLYIKCTPSIENRLIINNLLTDNTIIPGDMLYRPADANFGKANDVVYEHAYGILASDINDYISAVQINHYNRSITLGEIKTALAKDSQGNVIYEVVYSQVIDNLMEPNYMSIAAQFIVSGNTYTIINPGTTDFTKIGAQNNNRGTVFVATGAGVGTGKVAVILGETSVSKEIYWPYFIDLQLGPWYASQTYLYDSYEQLYTSLTPGYARTLYPNSLVNMRKQVASALGQDTNSKLLPLWMTSQQKDGSTLGFVAAWVICYTMPGYSSVIKNNIETQWQYKLNEINFQLDRFSVNKSETYNFNNNIQPPGFTSYPSADPVPNPTDSKDFFVLFPRTTILPDQTQY
jgi:hypothetical protein